MKRAFYAAAILLLAAAVADAVESGRFRLLSISETTRIILVSRIPDKTKYVLDATTAKIMSGEKPAEFTDLKVYTLVTVKFELKKLTKNGIELDGVATEIRIGGSGTKPASN